MRFHPLSQKQLVISAGAIVAVSFISMLWGTDSSHPDQPFDSSRINAERAASIQAIAAGTDHGIKSTFTSVGLPVVTSTPSLDAGAAKEPLQLWSSADLKAATPSIQLNERVVEYQAVQVESRWGHVPVPGQTVVMPLLHGESVSVQVESVQTLSNGDVSWSGHVTVDGDSYPVIMTLGEHSSFATITTPKGSYTLESVNGSGWLYKNPAEVELSAPGNNDYLDITNP